MLPGLIAAAAYFITILVILPLIRHNRDRYDQYLPVHTISGSLATHAAPIRDRITGALGALIFRKRNHARVVDGSIRRVSDVSEDATFSAEDVEDMVGFNVSDLPRRREELRRDVAGMEYATRKAELLAVSPT